MKHIKKKTSEPEKFTRWKKDHKNPSWNDFSKHDKHNTLKRELREQLISEQLGICCYCETMISLDDSHIDHLKPKSIYHEKMFIYGNLLASCNRKKSCGCKKDNWYAPDMVSPLNDDCELRFTYNLDGRITPLDKEDTAALETIEQLGLNCFELKNQRKSIITAVENLENDPDFVDFLQSATAGILQKEKAWPFGFYTVLLYLAEEYKISIPH